MPQAAGPTAVRLSVDRPVMTDIPGDRAAGSQGIVQIRRPRRGYVMVLAQRPHQRFDHLPLLGGSSRVVLAQHSLEAKDKNRYRLFPLDT